MKTIKENNTRKIIEASPLIKGSRRVFVCRKINHPRWGEQWQAYKAMVQLNWLDARFVSYPIEPFCIVN